jgi:DNA-binding NarL/FixJ family response regulator
VRVVVGEDLTLLRDGLIRLLTAYDMEVVEAADYGPALLRALVTHRPDKDRVSDVRRFIEAVRIVAGGGTAMDPEVISQLLARRARDESLRRLTPREREVLALMAEGRTNAGIATRLVVTEKAVSKHINNIFNKLDLYPGGDDNRRVLAVLAYLNA